MRQYVSAYVLFTQLFHLNPGQNVSGQNIVGQNVSNFGNISQNVPGQNVSRKITRSTFYYLIKNISNAPTYPHHPLSLVLHNSFASPMLPFRNG